MRYWDSLPRTKQSQLRNFQLAREEQWKQDMYVKFKQSITDKKETPACFDNVIDEHATHFAKCLEVYIDAAATEVGRLPDWVSQVMTLGYDTIAYVTIKSIFDCSLHRLVSSRFEDDRTHQLYSLPTGQEVARRIANDVVMLKQWFSAKDAEPEFFKHQTRFFKNWDNRRRKAFIKRVNVWDSPTQDMKDKFGHAILRLAHEYELIELMSMQIKNGGKKKERFMTQLHVSLNPELIEYSLRQVDNYLLSVEPNRLPMVCQPVPWTAHEAGGMQDFTLRTRNKLTGTLEFDESGEAHATTKPSLLGDVAIRTLNTLQSTEWRVNDVVLDTMRHFWDSNISVGSAPKSENDVRDETPPRPDKGEDKVAYALWCQARATAWGDWHRTENSRVQHMLRIKEASKIRNFTLWHAWFCDFRGRFYSDSYLIHPQGGDLDKSLLKAAQPVEVTTTALYWIKVNLANLFGVDKCSFDDRVAWCDSQMEIWREVAADPFITREHYEDDSPKKNATFQRLAAIVDLIKAIDEGITEVPVQIDGSCNGIQHWAALTRDETIGPEVNLCSHSHPRDVYQLVADACTDMCAEPDDHGWHTKFLNHYEGLIPRGVVKRSVMCDPYGIKPHSVKKYVLQEKHMAWIKEEKEQRLAASAMGNLICRAKDVAMQHCNHGKKFVQLLSGWVMGEIGTSFSWVTPNGFTCRNHYDPLLIKPIGVRLWNKGFTTSTNFKLQFGTYQDVGHDDKSAVAAMSPNFVHSLDAAHMSLVVDRLSSMGIEHFSMIHDSFGVMAPYMPMLRDVTKEVFYEIHNQDQLQLLLDRAEELVEQSLPSGHPAWEHFNQRGSLDIAEVLESDYLFG